MKNLLPAKAALDKTQPPHNHPARLLNPQPQLEMYSPKTRPRPPRPLTNNKGLEISNWMMTQSIHRWPCITINGGLADRIDILQIYLEPDDIVSLDEVVFIPAIKNVNVERD